MPQVWCEIAFAKDTTDSTPLWRDVTDDVQWWAGVTIARRRSHELDEVQPGTLALGLENLDGRYTAGNTSSIHYPNVKINRPIRVRARWPVSVNLLAKAQAEASDASLFGVPSAGTITVDAAVFPAGQTSSVRWDTGTLAATGQRLRVGASAITTATDQGIGVTAGTGYAFSCQVRRDASLALSVNARVRWYDSAGTLISESASSATALTTSFQPLSVSATAPAGAVWARCMIATTTTTAGTVAVYAGALQFEQAAAPTPWASPGVEYTRYVGYVDRWPHAWAGGVLGMTSVNATDQTKLLSRQRISREALIEETLATGPTFYYPCAESTGATAAGNRAATIQPDLTIIQNGTGGTLTFGATQGPLGSAIVAYAPADPENGKGLIGRTLTPLGGGAAITTAAWVICTSSSGDGVTSMVHLEDPSGATHQRFGYRFSSNEIDFGSQVNGTGSGSGLGANLEDGKPHHLVFVGVYSGGALQQRIWLDGVQIVDSATGILGSAWPQTLRVLQVGGQSTYPTNSNHFAGCIGQVAGWNRALGAGEITTLYNAGAAATELAGQRINRVLDWAGVTTRDIDPGRSLLDITAYGSADSSLRDIRQAAASDGGLFFISSSGASVFHDRGRRQHPAAAPLITLTADQCGPGLDFIVDDTLLLNDVTVNRSGTASRVTDPASVEEYGQYSTQIDTVLASDTDALDRGRYLLGRYANPSVRTGQITVDVHAIPALWPSLLDADIGHRIQITGLPGSAPSSSVELWVEGIADQITDQTWQVSIDTSPVTTQTVLVLDDPAYGKLDNNHLGW